ncbi:hypothetical protein D9758_016280 [Tetrapyrgos nigripes]|uniref:RTA1-domain-containing protein n=1 Tax=Tetrapyrgos nigripes TaxID=182062 RepID=A0A8H5FHA5_9AGAR|nr:hypothetical protein D9758_016280 [Tetrapyrgos nigripes]
MGLIGGAGAQSLNGSQLRLDASTSTGTDTDDDSDRILVAGFIPKNSASIIAIVAYTVSGVIHWIHYFRFWPRRRYMLTLTIGMTGMVMGFILRIAYSANPYWEIHSNPSSISTLIIFIVMSLFILCSPCAFLALDYVLFEHLSQSPTFGLEVSRKCLALPSSLSSPTSRISIVKIFVWADIVTFNFQSTGGGLQTDNPVLSNIGRILVNIGLVLQLISFGFFVYLLLVFGYRIRTSYPHLWHMMNPHGQTFSSTIGLFKTTAIHDWRILFYMLCFSCICIIIRSAFRVVEYAQGYNGFLSTHEGYFYLLDALPLWLAMTQFCFFWPSRFLDTQGMTSASGGPSVDLQTPGKTKLYASHEANHEWIPLEAGQTSTSSSTRSNTPPSPDPDAATNSNVHAHALLGEDRGSEVIGA